MLSVDVYLLTSETNFAAAGRALGGLTLGAQLPWSLRPGGSLSLVAAKVSRY